VSRDIVGEIEGVQPVDADEQDMPHPEVAGERVIIRVGGKPAGEQRGTENGSRKTFGHHISSI
jgi:hypothetical protein